MTSHPIDRIVDEALARHSSDGDRPPFVWDTDELRQVVAGDYTPPGRGVLHREDGQGLLYLGQIIAVVAVPEGGKTLLAYFALGATHDRPVALFDFEMGPVQVGERLGLLGVTALGPHWHYAYRPRIEDAVAAVPAGSVVVIDATDGGFAVLDLNPNYTGDANRFEMLVTAPLKQKGCTVVLLDHASTSQREGSRKRGPMGNTKKLGNVDASLYLTVEQPGSPQHVGVYQLFVDKDRSAQLRGISRRVNGEDHLATMRTETVDGVLDLEFLTPRPWRPTNLMEQVSRLLEDSPASLPRGKIDEQIEGKAKHVRLATDLLVGDGYVERRTGPHNAQMHTSIKPYRQSSDPRMLPTRVLDEDTE